MSTYNFSIYQIKYNSYYFNVYINVILTTECTYNACLSRAHTPQKHILSASQLLCHKPYESN